MEQKVIKVGNSFGILLPKYIVKRLGIKLGQKLYVDVYEHEKSVVLRINKNLANGITPEFIKYLEEFSNRYAPALRELAKR